MKNKLILVNQNPSDWVSHNCVFVKGYAFDEQGSYLEGESLACTFTGLENLEQVKNIVCRLNGLFVVIIKNGTGFILATDITRTYPIFYYKSEDGWVVSDDANSIKEKFGLTIDKNLSEEFLFAGYMTEDKTLVKDLYQVRAHELVAIDESVKAEPYFSYETNAVEYKSLTKYQEIVLSCYDRVGDRLIKALKGRTAVLPLSGGYDSRLVLSLLKEKNYKKIICFSYGTKSSYEVSIAKDVAKAMGVRFLIIEYSRKFIIDNLKKKIIIDYEKYAGNLSSLPHVQDFLSVSYLKNNKLIPIDSVFVPGIAGDIFAGTQIPESSNYKMTNQEINTQIIQKYLNFNKDDFKSKLNINSDFYGYSAIESFCVKEKVPKFVANSVRAYEFLGFNFLLPLMDKELLTLFKYVPLELKKRNFKKEYSLQSNLYDSTNFIIFKKLKVDIPKTDSRMFFARYKNFFMKVIGLQVDSINNFDTFINKFENLINFKTSFKNKKNTNLALSELYLYLINNKI